MKHRKAGMTFVEVIVAMTIFAILIVGIFPAFLIGIKLNAASKVKVETASVAQSTMESVYAYTLTSTLPQTIVAMSADYPSPVYSGNTTTLTKTTATYTIVIVFTSNTPLTGLTKTKITVTKLDNPYGAQPAQVESILLFQ